MSNNYIKRNLGLARHSALTIRPTTIHCFCFLLLQAGSEVSTLYKLGRVRSVPWVRSVFGHFGPGSEVSLDTSDLGRKCLWTLRTWVRNVSGPKCPGSEVSGKHGSAYHLVRRLTVNYFSLFRSLVYVRQGRFTSPRVHCFRVFFCRHLYSPLHIKHINNS